LVPLSGTPSSPIAKEKRGIGGDEVLLFFFPSSPVVGRRGTKGDEGASIKNENSYLKISLRLYPFLTTYSTLVSGVATATDP